MHKILDNWKGLRTPTTWKISDLGFLSRAGSEFHRLSKNLDKVMTAGTSKRFQRGCFCFQSVAYTVKQSRTASKHSQRWALPPVFLAPCSHMRQTKSKSSICLMFLIMSVFGYKFSRLAKLPWSNSGLLCPHKPGDSDCNRGLKSWSVCAVTDTTQRQQFPSRRQVNGWKTSKISTLRRVNTELLWPGNCHWQLLRKDFMFLSGLSRTLYILNQEVAQMDIS